MEMAFVHVVGALLATLAFWVFAFFLAAWAEERVEQRRRQDASIALGVPIAALDEARVIPELLNYSSQRCSAELLRNRISDLAGGLRTAWGWLSNIVQLGIVGGVFWAMHSSGSQNAVAMWLVPVASVFFWLTSLVFSYACLVLTGRYPGEAKAARNALAAFIEQHNLMKTVKLPIAVSDCAAHGN